MDNSMYYCPNCNKVFKAGGTGKRIKCTQCAEILYDMKISSEDYSALSKEGRESIKSIIKENATANKIENSKPTVDVLASKPSNEKKLLENIGTLVNEEKNEKPKEEPIRTSHGSFFDFDNDKESNPQKSDVVDTTGINSNNSTGGSLFNSLTSKTAEPTINNGIPSQKNNTGLKKFFIAIRDNKLLRNIIIISSTVIILLLITIVVLGIRGSKRSDNSKRAESNSDFPTNEGQNSINDDDSSNASKEDIEEVKATIDTLFEKLYQGDYKNIDAYLDEPFDFYNNVYQIDNDTLLKLLYSKYSYEIEDVDIDPDSGYAFADIKLSHPDSRELLNAQIDGWSFESNSMANALRNKLNSNDLTISTDNVRLSLSRKETRWIIYTKDGSFYNMLNFGMNQKSDTNTITENEKRIAENKEYIDNYLEISAKVGMNSGYNGTVPGISDISIKNHGNKNIIELTVTVYFQDNSGKNIAEDSFMVIGGLWGGDTLKANYSWKMEDDKFYEFEHLADEVDINRNYIEISSITFE